MKNQLNTKYDTYELFRHLRSHKSSLMVCITRPSKGIIHLSFNAVGCLGVHEFMLYKQCLYKDAMQRFVATFIGTECDACHGYNMDQTTTSGNTITAITVCDTLLVIGLKYHGTDEQLKVLINDWWLELIKDK